MYVFVYIYTCIFIRLYIGIYTYIYVKFEKENVGIFRVGYCFVVVICNFFFEFFSILLIL